jgi:hypothetical protein
VKKLAPAFRQMMVNTADSPLMEFFQEYNIAKTPSPSPTVPATTASSTEAATRNSGSR